MRLVQWFRRSLRIQRPEEESLLSHCESIESLLPQYAEVTLSPPTYDYEQERQRLQERIRQQDLDEKCDEMVCRILLVAMCLCFIVTLSLVFISMDRRD